MEAIGGGSGHGIVVHAKRACGDLCCPNLLAGIGARRGHVIPYAQAKAILKSDSEFVVAVGLRF